MALSLVAGILLGGGPILFLLWLVRPAAVGGGDWKLLRCARRGSRARCTLGGRTHPCRRRTRSRRAATEPSTTSVSSARTGPGRRVCHVSFGGVHVPAAPRSHLVNSRFAPIVGLCVLLALAGCSGDDGSGASNDSSAPSAGGRRACLRLHRPAPALVTTVPPTDCLDENLAFHNRGCTGDDRRPEAAAKGAVAAAIVQSRQDYLYAVGNYDAPDALEVLFRSSVVARVARPGTSCSAPCRSMQANGYRLRPHPSVTDASAVEGDVETPLTVRPPTKSGSAGLHRQLRCRICKPAGARTVVIYRLTMRSWRVGLALRSYSRTAPGRLYRGHDSGHPGWARRRVPSVIAEGFGSHRDRLSRRRFTGIGSGGGPGRWAGEHRCVVENANVGSDRRCS